MTVSLKTGQTKGNCAHTSNSLCICTLCLYFCGVISCLVVILWFIKYLSLKVNVKLLKIFAAVLLKPRGLIYKMLCRNHPKFDLIISQMSLRVIHRMKAHTENDLLSFRFEIYKSQMILNLGADN